MKILHLELFVRIMVPGFSLNDVSYLSHRIIDRFPQMSKLKIKLKTSLISPDGFKVQANKTVFNFMFFISIFVEYCP